MHLTLGIVAKTLFNAELGGEAGIVGESIEIVMNYFMRGGSPKSAKSCGSVLGVMLTPRMGPFVSHRRISCGWGWNLR